MAGVITAAGTVTGAATATAASAVTATAAGTTTGTAAVTAVATRRVTIACDSGATITFITGGLTGFTTMGDTPGDTVTVPVRFVTGRGQGDVTATSVSGGVGRVSNSSPSAGSTDRQRLSSGGRSGGTVTTAGGATATATTPATDTAVRSVRGGVTVAGWDKITARRVTGRADSVPSTNPGTAAVTTGTGHHTWHGTGRRAGHGTGRDTGRVTGCTVTAATPGAPSTGRAVRYTAMTLTIGRLGTSCPATDRVTGEAATVTTTTPTADRTAHIPVSVPVTAGHGTVIVTAASQSPSVTDSRSTTTG